MKGLQMSGRQGGEEALKDPWERENVLHDETSRSTGRKSHSA